MPPSPLAVTRSSDGRAPQVTVGLVAPTWSSWLCADGAVVSNPEHPLDTLANTFQPNFLVPVAKRRWLSVQRKLCTRPQSLVFEVRDAVTRRASALKAVPIDSPTAARFLAEVELLQRLNHPNILEYQQHVVLEVARLYFIAVQFELCSKGSLADKLLRREQKSKRLSSPCILGYMSQLTSALRYIHSQGNLHGDVRPENILLCADGTLRLTGMSMVGLPSTPDCDVSVTGGTRWYSPPEWSGKVVQSWPQSIEDTPPPAYDWWSLGCTLAELATLKRLSDRFPTAETLANDPNALAALHDDVRTLRRGAIVVLVIGLLNPNPIERLEGVEVEEVLKPATSQSNGVSWPRVFRSLSVFGCARPAAEMSGDAGPGVEDRCPSQITFSFAQSFAEARSPLPLS